MSLTFLQPVTLPRREAGPGEPKAGAVPLTWAQAWAPQPCSPPLSARPGHGRGWHLLPTLPMPQFPTLRHPGRARCRCQALRRKCRCFIAHFSHGSPSAARAGRSPAPAPIWSRPGQHLHRLGEESVPKWLKKPRGHNHEGGRGWGWFSRPLCTPKPRTPSHSIPSQRLCDPKAPARSKYFPVFQCRAQRGYRKQLCQTNLTSFVEEILSLVEKKKIDLISINSQLELHDI